MVEVLLYEAAGLGSSLCVLFNLPSRQLFGTGVLLGG